jgi:HK97 family phage prohead protease
MQKHTYIMKRAEQDAPKEKVTFIASTSSADRYGDIIDQKGWLLDSYKKNPVVLLNHDSNSLPIGKGNVYVRNDKLTIDVQFDQEDPRAKEVERKAQKGYMNAVSVGFRPLESQSRSELPKDNKYYGQRGTYYSKAELLEVSIVTIPANGEATMLEQKYFNTLKSELLTEMKEYLDHQMIVNKHILSVREEDDKYIVEFAKPGNEERMEEEEEKAMDEEEEKYGHDEEDEKEMEEEEERDMDEEEKAEHDEEEKELEEEEKDFDNIIEAFAYILTTK